MITPSNDDCGLIIFLRLPEKGKVKSRLAQTAGQDKALMIYKALSGITLRLASILSFPVYLFYEGGLPDASVSNPSFQYKMQGPGDLGEKMMDAMQQVLQLHPKVIIIGSDCPDISVTDIYHSSELLDRFDVVIGPSKDGGYYLLGGKEIIPSVFKSMEWSTTSVLNETITRIRDQGKTYSLLRELQDIDTEEDWNQYSSRS